MTGTGNWTWYLPGRVPTLIDAGTGDPRHLQALADALGGAELLQVLVTHGHTDHAAGAPAIAGRWPRVRVRKMPWPERDARLDVRWEPLADGDRVAAGDGRLLVVHTPGHAPDHLCFLDEAEGVVFCGDLVIRGTSVWIPGGIPGAMTSYLASLDRLLAIAPRRMYPAHGRIIDDPAALLAAARAHRLEREAQVLDALRAGGGTVAGLTAAIYRGLDAALLRLAGESVTAHLHKLEAEGRARRSGEAWSIMEP